MNRWNLLRTIIQLVAFRHHGFWKCMDALRDKIELEDLWKNNEAKWKVW